MNLGEGSAIDVGIDVGKRRVAYSWPAHGVVDFYDLVKPGLPRSHELRMMRNWIASRLPENVQLWIDEPLSHGNGIGSIAARGLNETVVAIVTAHSWVHEPIRVYSSTWKSQVVGNHQAEKDDLKDWLVANVPQLAYQCRTQDEIDASIVGIYGKGRSDGVILPPDVRRPKRRTKRS